MYKINDELGGCKLLKECGKGAFGSVFLAENLSTHLPYALKILYKQGNHYERELAGLIAYQEKCRHASLMRIYHVDQNDECIFYLMDAADNLNGDGEYLPDTLGNRLGKHKRLEASELRPMLDELLNGLEILHGAGLLHRDIKPDNILWVGGHAVLGDIGLVTFNGSASFAGTPDFMSPAIRKGERDFAPQDDLYALAMTLYCAFSGCVPKIYPELPFSLTLGGGRDLIRIYNAVLASDSKICTVADWRRFESTLHRRKGSPKKRYLKIIFVGILILGGVYLFCRNGQDSKTNVTKASQPVPNPSTHPEQLPVIETRPLIPAKHEPVIEKKTLIHRSPKAEESISQLSRKNIQHVTKTADVSKKQNISDVPLPQLPPIPPMPKNYEDVEAIKAGGKILQQRYRDKVAEICKGYQENPRLAALIEKFEQVKDRIDRDFQKKFPDTLPLEEVCIVPIQKTVLQKEEHLSKVMGRTFERTVFAKQYAEKYKRSQLFLASYSEELQAIYKYISYKVKENWGKERFLNDYGSYPDTPSNRAVYERDFCEWYMYRLLLLSTETQLLKFPL